MNIRDYLAFIGLLLLGYGLYLEHPPYAFIVDGSILVLISVFGVARGNS